MQLFPCKNIKLHDIEQKFVGKLKVQRVSSRARFVRVRRHIVCARPTVAQKKPFWIRISIIRNIEVMKLIFLFKYAEKKQLYNASTTFLKNLLNFLKLV